MSSLITLPRVLGLLALLVVGGGIAAGVWVMTIDAPQLEASGPDGERIGTPGIDDLSFAVASDDADALRAATLTLNDEDVTGDTEIDDGVLTYEPGELPDGAYELDLDISQDFPNRDASHSWAFEIDTEPPEIAVEEPTDEVPWGEPAVVAGTVDDAAELTANGESVELAGGSFEVEYEVPPDEVELVATDELGNVSSDTVEIAIAPREPPGMQGVHVSMWAWADAGLREPIIDMVEAGQIDTIQLDIKDEDGAVGYESEVELAQESGAARDIYDLDEALAELEDLDVHVVGRIVAFADPILTRWLWEEGERDMVIQTPGGERYTGAYDGFSNFAHPDIRQYNIDLAVEAAEAGFDDILYDYVRRPDGSLDNMVIPGLETTPEDAIIGFLAESEEALRPTQAWHGASVYGIAADRPTQIGQDIEGISQHVDYVAPMVYPSHWGPGEYGVEDPNNQPYDIVAASLQVFQEVMEGSDARIVPWLQDFSLGATYGPDEVRAQIDAAADLGIEEFLLWNAGSRYTSGALD